VDRAQEGSHRANAIGHMPPAGFVRLFGIHRPAPAPPDVAAQYPV